MYANENGDLVMPELTADFIGKQKYVRKNLIIKVLHDDISAINPQLAAAVRALVEIHAEEVDGFNNDLDRNRRYFDHAANVCIPFFRVKEIYGKAVSATINRLHCLEKSGVFKNGMFTFIAIEPDSTATQVVDAWIVNVKGIHSFEGPSSRLDKNHPISDEVVYCSFGFDGDVQSVMTNYDIDGGNIVLDKAKEVLSGLNVQGSNPPYGMGSVLGFAQRVVENNKQILTAAEGNPQPDA